MLAKLTAAGFPGVAGADQYRPQFLMTFVAHHAF